MLHDNNNLYSDPLGRALHDVPVPVGLANSILARLAAAPGRNPAAHNPAAQDRAAWPADVQNVTGPIETETAVQLAQGGAGTHAATQPTQRRFGRRLVWTGVLSSLAMSLVAWIGWEYARPIWPAQVLVEQVVLHHAQREAQTSPLSGNPLQFSSQIAQPAGGAVGQRMAGLPGRWGTAYDLHYKTARATLYVVSIRATDLPATPSVHPDLASGGYAAGAWQEGKLTYVLVVEGGPRQYRQIVEPRQRLAVVATR